MCTKNLHKSVKSREELFSPPPLKADGGLENLGGLTSLRSASVHILC